MRTISLSTRLALIVSAAILPLAVVCGAALYALIHVQRAQTQASTLGVARAVATAVDSELRLTISALEALALTEPLAASSPEGLADARRLANAVRASHPEWRGLLLIAPDGRVVFGTDGPGDSTVTQAVEPASLADVARSGRPAVGPMARGPAGNLAFPVRVPVVREGSVRYVLTAVVRPEAIGTVLQRQRTPEGWTVSVFDSADARVARNEGNDRLRGSPPSDTLRALMARMGQRREMVGTSVTVDGVPVQTAVARLEVARWFVALGASVAVSEDTSRRTLIALGGGLLASIGLAGLAAAWMSRAVTRPMARLRRSAEALGRGEPVTTGPLGLAEADTVTEALAGAERQRARAEAEREKLLDAERIARTQAQAASHRLARLVHASAVLSRSLEEESTLAAIAEVIVPDVADVCRIDLLDDSGRLERKLTHHREPERAAAMAGWIGQRHAAADAPGSFPWAIATGRTFVQNMDDPALPELPDADLREFVRSQGITAGCVVPLVARGRTIGAMAVLQAGSGRRFGTDDAALVGELAQRAALALDNVRLLAGAREAQSQAETANKAKDEFLAMLGHELRNPLAPISLALQLVARRDPQAFPRERQLIERQVRHLSRMVDDLLDVSRIVAGKIVLRPELVDLRDVVARALELTLPALRERPAMPHIALPDAPVMVRGDALRLAQIVCNLLNNAVKFSPPDTPIALRLTLEAGQAVLRVSDRGIGIPPGLLPHVFDRFVQGEQPLQRAAGGLGLGLAIARSLVSLHDGRIEAHSEGAGQGSEFTVHLPLDHAPAQAAATPAEAAPIAAALRLLLVDDNRDAVEALADWLRLDGHEVHACFSAEEALAFLQGQAVDAAVFDIGLPVMSGYELARRLRADPAWRTLPLIALTGYGRDADRAQALNAGFDDHFAKPVDVELMTARIAALAAARKG